MFGLEAEKREASIGTQVQYGTQIQYDAQAHNPVVLVPGFRDNYRVFSKLIDHLAMAGFSIHPLSLKPSDGRVPLNQLADQVAAYVENTFPASQSLDFVGFSMGGLVTRYYLQRLGGVGRTHRFVTLGSPHRGTWIAYGSSRPGVRQMRPGSDFLQDLAQDLEVLDEVDFTSIWTPLDLTIVPSTSSVMPVGREERLLLPHHRALVTDPRCLERVIQALRAPVRRWDD